MTTDEAHDELVAYTLSLGDADFVHQHVVDAWAAQHASTAAKPIGVALALIGLYLHELRATPDGRHAHGPRRHGRIARDLEQAEMQRGVGGSRFLP